MTLHQRNETSSISQVITYPCQWLGCHLENGGERATWVPDVDKFMKTYFLQWLEILSLQRVVDFLAVSTLKIFKKRIKVSIYLLTKYVY